MGAEQEVAFVRRVFEDSLGRIRKGESITSTEIASQLRGEDDEDLEQASPRIEVQTSRGQPTVCGLSLPRHQRS